MSAVASSLAPSVPITQPAARGAHARWTRRTPPCTRARACRGAAGVRRGVAARTIEVQLGAALADLLQRPRERSNLTHASPSTSSWHARPPPCRAAAAPCLRSGKEKGRLAKHSMPEAGNLAIRRVRRSSTLHSRRYAGHRELQGAYGDVQRGAAVRRGASRGAAEVPRKEVRGAEKCVGRCRGAERCCCGCRGAEWCRGAVRRCAAQLGWRCGSAGQA